MNKKAEKAVIIVSLTIIIVLFVLFLRNIVVPLVKAEFAKDLDTASDLLRSHGLFGALSITVIEALQMVVIFISAEFIQISAGLSYPFPLAVLLCDAGVCLGATIIFVLVRTFRYSSSTYEKRKGKIDRLSRGSINTDGSMMMLMYFLLFMPIIPFGAICYRGAASRLPYRKYILTMATGAVPSILTSILMGSAARLFITNQIPIGYLILIIVACAAALFALIFFFLKKIYFKQNDGTPDSIVHTALFGLAHLLRSRRQKLTVDPGEIERAEEPFVMMSNHPSFYDFYYIDRLPVSRRSAIVANEYYMRLPFLRRLAAKTGLIPKKLFTSDVRSVGGILKMIRKGYSVTVFPEGRLSVDGTTYPIVGGTGGFFRRLGRDLVLVNISGAYYSKPKWRRAFFRSDITVRVTRVIKADELAAMTAEEVDAAIAEGISSRGGDLPARPYRRRDLAEGVEKLLYRCRDCGALYSLKGSGMTVTCRACGKELTLDGYYRFGDGSTLSDYYRDILNTERRELDSVRLETRADVKIFRKEGRPGRETGTCRMDRETFEYIPDSGEGFSIPMSNLEALAFSCGEEFELYHGDDLYYFYPSEEDKREGGAYGYSNRLQTVRWGALADLLTERRRNSAAKEE
ncbi:MAG: VTT domain-containing protein [Clostridia bacterium]|nr:VTT domain-containing protein [Clostridia bacterium]